MARHRRNTAPGFIHHVVNRGNRRKPIFHTQQDYRAFFSILLEALARFELRLLAFCLMRNHWHLVLWPDGRVSISAYMQWVTTTHVRRYHLHYGLTGTGHLYQGRFRNDICEDARGVLSVIRYVEGNPRAAGLVERAEDWRWSSLWLRVHGDKHGLLAKGPVEPPENWTQYVNESTPSPRCSPESMRRVRRSFEYTPDIWLPSAPPDLLS